MSGILLMLLSLFVFGAAYRYYGQYLSNKLKIDPSRETPSHTMYDGVDYVPAKTPVLLGHHFASIAGVGPIVGPVIAVSFGWLPVYAWVLIGAVLIGGVHDFSTIVASIRHNAKSIGQIIESYIGLSGKKLFLLFAWATLILVIAVFTIIVTDTFAAIPSSATSSILFIALAILFGLSIYRYKVPLWIATIIGVMLLFISIYLGYIFPIQFDKVTWQLLLFVYIFAASVTPVWILLQPRDYLNSYFLYLLIAAGTLGLFFSAPVIHQPAFAAFEVKNVGFLFPALFVTVACGAISGFHSIVASGTTAKQLNNEKDARVIGYGGMLIEGVLAVLSLVAVASMNNDMFRETLLNKGPVTAFSIGVAAFIDNIPLLNIPIDVSTSFVALAVSAFALTTLDTATRLARYSFQEFFEISGKTNKNTLVQNRFVSTFITIVIAGALTFSGQTMAIWPVFGSANQLLAALALLAITVWVSKLNMNINFAFIPMTFMFAVTLTALAMLFYTNLIGNNYILSFISMLLFVLAVILGLQAYKVLRRNGKEVALAK